MRSKSSVSLTGIQGTQTNRFKMKKYILAPFLDPDHPIQQMMWFLVGGLLALILDTAVFYLLLYFNLNLAFCNFMSRLTGAFISFGFNYLVTFRHRDTCVKNTLPLFAVIWSINTVISTILLEHLIKDFPFIKPFLELWIACFTFLLHKFLVFKEQPAES